MIIAFGNVHAGYKEIDANPGCSTPEATKPPDPHYACEREGIGMPRFYFNVRDGDTLIADREGVEMPGKSAAAEEARQAARDLLAERVKFGEPLESRQFEVVNDNGETILTLPFRSVLRLD
ncbi:MAG: hypothetical protein JWL86_6161 [Rhizobium sp.]|nr:hypothetical protein [Rhizobium sp.]